MLWKKGGGRKPKVHKQYEIHQPANLTIQQYYFTSPAYSSSTWSWLGDKTPISSAK